ncbi:hypothetical protein AB0M95_31435 [Sphaerisporangium sp. NPDC051017]|uniref:hypothetical protein n=1 Tax=Sphaerisporangium sp. NPDC051017 TaxID=3154636 RepID=UPI003440F9B9
MTGDRADLWRYARAHHLVQLLAGYGVATVVAWWTGGGEFVLPAANSRGWSQMASTSLTPIPFAVLAAGSLHSSMASLERAAGARLIRAELLHLATALVVAAGLVGGATAASGSVTASAEAVRNLVLYAGLALVSGRVFGRPLSWILPLAGFVVAAFWGADGSGPHWWAWPYQSYDVGGSWGGAVVLLLLGLAAVVMPPRLLKGSRSVAA